MEGEESPRFLVVAAQTCMLELKDNGQRDLNASEDSLRRTALQWRKAGRTQKNMHLMYDLQKGQASTVHCFGLDPACLLLGVTLLVGIEMSFFWYRDFSIFFLVSRSLSDLHFTGRRGAKTARVDPWKKTVSMPNTRMLNLDTKKRDLGHLDTTKKTSRCQKKMHPFLFLVLKCSGGGGGNLADNLESHPEDLAIQKKLQETELLRRSVFTMPPPCLLRCEPYVVKPSLRWEMLLKFSILCPRNRVGIANHCAIVNSLRIVNLLSRSIFGMVGSFSTEVKIWELSFWGASVRQKKSQTHAHTKINFLGPEIARWGGGLSANN